MGTYAIAHRGFSADHPENTMEAIEAALDHAPVVEIDVRATSDGVLVCAHDPSLERCHGHPGKIGQLSWDELHEAAPSIPRLGDVLGEFGGQAAWFLDCKVTRPRAIDALVEALQHTGMRLDTGRELRHGIPPEEGSVVFESSDPGLVQRMRSRTGVGCVELVTGVLGSFELSFTAPFVTAYAQGVVINERIATKPLVRLLRALRLGVYVYTVNDQQRFDQLARAGASAVFVDAIDRVGPGRGKVRVEHR